MNGVCCLDSTITNLSQVLYGTLSQPENLWIHYLIAAFLQYLWLTERTPQLLHQLAAENWLPGAAGGATK